MTATYFCPACATRHTEQAPSCRACGEKMSYAPRRRKRAKRGLRSNLKGVQRRAKMEALRKRDGDTCWLCHGEINFDVSPDTEWGWSLDHQTPVSLGGSNALGNLKLAHRFCNKQRGASLD